MSHGLKTEGVGTASPLRTRRQTHRRLRRCNLCADEFHPRTVFDRYCTTCKQKSELLKFSEWLPELDAAITERLSA